MRARLLLAFSATALSFAGAEMGLRAVGFETPRPAPQFLGRGLFRDGFQRHPTRFWALDPANAETLVNRYLTRGLAPRGPRAERECRIVCVGDSCTYGAGVRDDQTYALVLERKLQEHFPDLAPRSFRAAVPGYSSEQCRVLVEEIGDELEADVMVVYCGAWNDYAAAVGHSDPEWRELLAKPRSPSRLLQLLEFRRERTTEVDAEERRRQFADGEAPDGRRVPPERYRENLEAICTSGRRPGSKVVIVLPPLPETTRSRHAAATKYARIARDFAEETGASVLDGTALFQEFLQHCAAEETEEALFLDWVHPSALGHRLLADALAELVLADPPQALSLPALSLPARSPRAHSPQEPNRGSVIEAPFEVLADSTTPRALTEAVVRLRGSWPSLDSIHRVWIGEAWAREISVSADGILECRVGPELPAGSHSILIATEQGSWRADRAIAIEAPLFEAVAEPEGDDFVLRLRGEGPPGGRAAVYVAESRLPASLLTRFGPWWIVPHTVHARGDDGPIAAFDAGAPFLFEALGKAPWYAEIAEDGTWSHAARFPASAKNSLGGQVLQAWITARTSEGGSSVTGTVVLPGH